MRIPWKTWLKLALGAVFGGLLYYGWYNRTVLSEAASTENLWRVLSFLALVMAGSVIGIILLLVLAYWLHKANSTKKETIPESTGLTKPKTRRRILRRIVFYGCLTAFGIYWWRNPEDVKKWWVEATNNPTTRGDMKLRCGNRSHTLPKVSAFGNFTLVVPAVDCLTEIQFPPSGKKINTWRVLNGKVYYEATTSGGEHIQGTDSPNGPDFPVDGYVTSMRFKNLGKEKVYIRLQYM